MPAYPTVANRLRQQILDLAGHELTSAQIRARLNSRRSTTGSVLREMANDGEVERIGWRTRAVWRIIGANGKPQVETPYQKRRRLAGWPPLEDWESRL